MISEITDAGIEHLARLTNLEHLDVAGSNMTPQGVKQAPKRHSPTAKIDY